MASKLDSLSKEDLVKFTKKQLGILKETKDELSRLRTQLQDTEKAGATEKEKINSLETENSRLSRRVEELETKQNFLVETTQVESDAPTATELVLRSRISDLEESLKQIPLLKNENAALVVDVASVREEMNSLASQLEDKVAELAALKDQKSTADMFSLEIEDYDRKVRTLEKDLAASRQTTKSLEAELSSIRLQLEESKNAQFSIDDDRRKYQQDVQKLTNDLCESQIANSQLKKEISSLKDQLNGLMENQGSEKLGLGRELASSQQRIAVLEEISEALREENIRLKAENNCNQSRLKEVEQEFESFKSRARFVLEQKKAEAMTGEDEQADRSRTDELKANAADLLEQNEALRKELAAKHDELEKFKERTTTALSDLEAKRREADELHTSLSNSMDEIRSYRIKFENVVAQLTETSQRLGETDNEKALLRSDIIKSEALLKFERNAFEDIVKQLNEQLAEERRKREEISSQLDESRREQKTPRQAAPVATVQPQIFEVEYANSADQARRTTPDSLSLHQAVDRSLEDVLFGEEEHFDELIKTPTVENISELVEEIQRLRKQAEHTTSLLQESEAANGRLTEQSHCLKEEIRRLERNEERKSHLENTEYLKNVIVKFLTPEKVAAEKAQLIPILNTMLRLSDDEMQILQRAAQQDSSTLPPPGSWGSYFKWGSLA